MVSIKLGRIERALDKPPEAAGRAILSIAWFYAVSQFTDEETGPSQSQLLPQGHVGPEPRPPTSPYGIFP